MTTPILAVSGVDKTADRVVQVEMFGPAAGASA
jgi:hypothetical protein